ncbi:TetR/AcrR family transcriptional regulator [Alkalihalobacillus pseudalcaliphilus]|uniref:TetR/AcrR family transcriptional regulator n=1 Tax=Alkalihalobacillus pseudalcaliphilus TaxID=79884 RepID=UPI00064DD581|nr:TetR/AcrR family transcriptional regulator [Alkalihalobacillus pseudalcaliphilus]KMK75255.1 hypothetical protein AB990_17695 [Alkalihalobacillus pseudalcaliphilus]
MSKKRQDLISQAERLFYEHGFHSIGLKKIIEEANVALMTMYNHFNSKEELVLEVLKYREEKYFSLLQKVVKKEADVNTNAQLIAKAHLDWIATHKKGCMFLRAKEEYPAEENQINQYVITHKKTFLTFLESLHFSQNESIRLSMLLEGATSLAEVVDWNKVSKELLYTVDHAI